MGRNGLGFSTNLLNGFNLSFIGIVNHDLGTETVNFSNFASDTATFQNVRPEVFSVGNQDYIAWHETSGNKTTSDYSVDLGATRVPLIVYDDGNSENGGFLATSDDLIMITSDSVIVNQRQLAPVDLIANQEHWSNFKLSDINSNSMIVGTAENNGTEKIVALLKVDVEVPKLSSTGSEIANERISANKLNVATLEDSFSSDGSQIYIDFIEKDRDRFWVKAHLPGGLENVQVQVSTLSEDGSVLDQPTFIQMTEEQGFYTTKSLALVSGDIDDDYSNSENPGDEEIGDRTHKAVIGGELRIDDINWDGLSAPLTINKTIPIPIEKIVEVQPIVIQAGPLNQSVIDSSGVEFHMNLLKEAYYQAGVKIRVLPTVDVDEDEVAGFDLTNNLFVDSGLDINLSQLDELGRPLLSAEMISLMSYLFTGGHKTNDAITVVFVNELNGTNNDAIAYPIKKSVDTNLVGNTIFMAVDDIESDDQVVMAHEVLHLLLNAVHPTGNTDFTDEFNHGRMLWTGGVVSGGRDDPEAKIAISKRITKRSLNKQKEVIINNIPLSNVQAP